MEASDCLARLFNHSLSIPEKAEWLMEYLDWHACIGRSVGCGVKLGRQAGLQALYDALPHRESKEELARVVSEIAQHCAHERQAQQATAKDDAKKLMAIHPGTAIVIKNGNKEDVVRLVEVRRTRFICEFPDGRHCSAPAQLFVKVHEGVSPKQLSDDERRQREMVRALAGSNHDVVMQEIVGAGVGIVRILLDELAAAIDRVENAPVGMNRGLLRNSIPVFKKVNPRDAALSKRIPPVIAAIAGRFKSDAVREQINACRHEKAKELCGTALMQS